MQFLPQPVHNRAPNPYQLLRERRVVLRADYETACSIEVTGVLVLLALPCVFGGWVFACCPTQPN